MTRTAYPYFHPDISALARHLQAELAETPAPGHLALMNMLARGAGFRNFQHFRASASTELPPAEAPPDMTKVAQALRYFDGQGRMVSWPAKTNLQHLCLWGLWSRLPQGVVLTERQISDHLTQWHLFGDAAIVRRTLWELKLIFRTADSRQYRREEKAPSPEARLLIRALHDRA